MISIGKLVFEGEGITAIDFDQYLVEREDGQLEWVVPAIEVYAMRHTISNFADPKTREVLCPNTKTLKHDKNQWVGEQGDTIFTCSECNAKLDISTNKNIVEVGEVK